MFKTTFFKLLSMYLVLALALMTLPAPGWAMFIPGGEPETLQQDISGIQTSLESRVVQQRLADLGLSSEEAMARVNSLSDDQVHQFASQLDSLQAGADTVGTLLVVLLATLIVVGVLELTGHSVIVR